MALSRRSLFRPLLLLSFLACSVRALRGAFRLAAFTNIGSLKHVPFLRRPWKALAQQKNNRVTLSAGIDRARMSDEEILQKLNARHGWCCRDMGGGGDCLFLSIAPQICCSDFKDMPYGSEVWTNARSDVEVGEAWNTLPTKARASLLRRIAILDEAEFVAQLRDTVLNETPVSPQVHSRAIELFKDMAEEFMGRGQTELAKGLPLFGNFRKSMFNRIRELVRDMPPNAMYEYILSHADDYMQITGQEGNWAGSSEMIALANALRRSFCAYGNDLASHDDGVTIETFEDGAQEVLPYFQAEVPTEYTSSAPPVRVFQRSGGGHYQLLG